MAKELKTKNLAGCFMDASIEIWKGLRKQLAISISTLFVVILAAAARGDWILILVHYMKINYNGKNDTEVLNASQSPPGDGNISFDSFLVRHHMKDVHIYILLSVAVSYLSFYSITGWLQWQYYIKRRDKPEEWKCQPDKFLTMENEAHEFLMASINMAIGGTISGMIACYILNGGHTTLYFSLSDYSVFYLPVSLVIVYMFQEFGGYYAHRMYHNPFLYRHIHKWHHRYHQPTPFSATAMHPLEFITYQTLIALPAFFIPVYSGAFIASVLYIYYYGVLDHSGIMFDAIWPWQPPSLFHDDHHKYFHCNFGFNSYVFDWLHDTIRLKDRVYGEDIFGGKGKPKEN